MTTEAPYVTEARQSLALVRDEIKFSPPQTPAAVAAWRDRVWAAESALVLAQRQQVFEDTGHYPEDQATPA